MTDLFTRHPKSVGESYVEHFGAASGFGFRMIIAGFACVLHGIFPFLFIKTGSNCVDELHERMVTKRIKEKNKPAAEAHAAMQQAQNA